MNAPQLTEVHHVQRCYGVKLHSGEGLVAYPAAGEAQHCQTPVLSQSPIHDGSGAPASPGHICWDAPKIIAKLTKTHEPLQAFTGSFYSSIPELLVLQN